MNPFVVRKVQNNEAEQCFGVLRRVSSRLEQLQRRQRISHTTLETYLSWQRKAANYAVFANESVAGVFTLVSAPPTEWNSMSDDEVLWLRALATDPAYSGKSVGRLAIQSALSIAPKGDPVYLDCVSEFLPEYYRSMGFEFMAQQNRRYPEDDEAFEIVLMRHPNLSA